MWAWLTSNSVWIFIAAASILILLILLKERVWERRVKANPSLQRVHRRVDISFWTAEGFDGAVLVAAFLGMLSARQDSAALITTDMVLKWLLEHGTRLVAIILIGVVLWFALGRFLPHVMTHAVIMTKGEPEAEIRRRRHTLLSVFMSLGKVLIIVAVVVMILSELKIPIGPILAGFGIAGIAVGFGAQYLIRDLIAGVFIIMENQYRVGDVVKVADTAGLVEEVNLRKTVLRDLDGIVHHVPNGEIKVASNFTRTFSRVNLNVPVAYGTDLDKAIKVANRVCKELALDDRWGRMVIKPPEVLRVDDFSESGIELKILGDVQPITQWDVTGELRLRLKKAFDAEGIEIPWPHVKVYFGERDGKAKVLCPTCQQANLPGSKFCANCGARLGAD